MRYDITLTIEYAYETASDHARMLLHLLPSGPSVDQSVLSCNLTIDPLPDERRDAPDFFGNAATWVAFHAPIARFAATLTAQVSRHAELARMDLSTTVGLVAHEVAGHRGLGPDAPHHFLGPSARVTPDPAMTAFAMDLITPDMSIRAAVLAIGQALHAHMTFDSGATDVLTPPAEAFANARGVCQDFSHILIACLRGVGIPAGYVSGFLRTAPPPGQPRLEGADAMHAWVRAWCGAEMGWIDYDPTNDMTVGDDHIAVAVGRDYADVSPVRGTLRSIGGHVTGHSVDVVPHGPPQDTPLP